MNYYKTCPYCGAHLDPGERCDCRGALLDRTKDLLMKLSDDQIDRLMKDWEKEEAASGATNTESGKCGTERTPVSVSIIPTIGEVRQV